MIEHVSAGGVLYHQGKVYLIKKIERDEWQLPKGHVKKYETIQQTAIREVQEETGYVDVLITDLNPATTEYTFEKDGEMHHKIVYFYEMQAKSLYRLENTQDEGEGLDGEWVERKEVINKLSHLNEKEIYTEIEKL
jgi:8-oxo-dGTP pyrophosphatase MutT (NUDIX family)